MIEPFWWIRSAGIAAVPVSNREPQVSRRDRPTRAAFFVLHFPGRNSLRDFLFFRRFIPRECDRRTIASAYRNRPVFRSLIRNIQRQRNRKSEKTGHN